MSSRDVGFVLRFAIPLVLLGLLISLAEPSRDPSDSTPPRWDFGFKIMEFSKGAAKNIPYFWYSLSEPKGSFFFGAVAIGGTLLLGLSIWIGMKEIKSEFPTEAKTQGAETLTNLATFRPTSRLFSFKWRLAGTFVCMITLLGFLVVATVYRTTGRALRHQISQRASVIAANINEDVAPHLLTNHISELNAVIAKYVRIDEVAYVLIENGRREIVAHSLGILPEHLHETTAIDIHQTDKRLSSLNGKAVYETLMPILEGQQGVTRVGIWEDSVETEIFRTVYPIIGQIMFVLLCGLAVSVLLAGRIVRPIRNLIDLADKMSLGDLDTPIGMESQDEIGELARSLERMRASLKAAMVRLTGSHKLS